MLLPSAAPGRAAQRPFYGLLRLLPGERPRAAGRPHYSGLPSLRRPPRSLLPAPGRGAGRPLCPSSPFRPASSLRPRSRRGARPRSGSEEPSREPPGWVASPVPEAGAAASGGVLGTLPPPLHPKSRKKGPFTGSCPGGPRGGGPGRGRQVPGKMVLLRARAPPRSGAPRAQAPGQAPSSAGSQVGAAVGVWGRRECGRRVSASLPGPVSWHAAPRPAGVWVEVRPSRPAWSAGPGAPARLLACAAAPRPSRGRRARAVGAAVTVY